MHEIPDDLKPAPAERLVLKLQASGVQIYTCVAGADAERSWVLKGPDAALQDEQGAVVGSHYAGPTWKHRDGSEITGKPVARVDAPDPLAIPWLLLSVTERSGSGVLSRVTSIQRIHTTGGKAPAHAGDRDAELRVPYTAVYCFYAPETG